MLFNLGSHLPASEMTYIVSGGVLNSTHSLTHCLLIFLYVWFHIFSMLQIISYQVKLQTRKGMAVYFCTVLATYSFLKLIFPSPP